MILRNGSFFAAVALSASLLSSPAQAHWCNDLWGSAYNIVVRPESDTVTVPASGSASLNVFVQNNMGYALPNFGLVADIAGKAVTAARQTQKVNGTLLPGEKAKYTLTVTKTGGGAVAATDINFSINFGNSGQDNMYGAASASGAKAAMIKKSDGSLFPAAPVPALGKGSSVTQGMQLLDSAITDFGDTNSGLDKLLQLYCAGRASWDTGSAAVVTSNCTNTASTSCPTQAVTASPGTKWDYPHLWAAVELAARKSGLGARTAVLRQRLQCGVTSDTNISFSGFAMMMLGYLGEDAGARTFIQGYITKGGDLGTIAKAALLLMGNAADMTTYKADVVAGAKAAKVQVAAACAAALGIAAKDDATVSSSLIPLAKWVEPDTSDNGQSIYAAQLLNLVAWDRRGWAAGAGDTGAVTFYGETSTGAGGTPASSGGATGSGGVTGSGGAPGNGGATGAGGTSGNKDAGGNVDAKPGTGGALAGGGATAAGGSTPAGSTGGSFTSAGGAVGTGGSAGGSSSAGSMANAGGAKASGGAVVGGVPGSGGQANAGGEQAAAGTTSGTADASTGCKCNLATHAAPAPTFWLLALVGLAGIVRRRRK